MLVLGDAHAADPDHRAALLRAYDAVDADHAIQVGDLQHYDLPLPTWFIAGNNEELDVVEQLRADEAPDDVRNAHLLASSVVELDGCRIAGLSGNFAPTQFDKSRDDLDGDRRRHFVRTDVERAKALADVDVFLSHEAPHGLLESGGYDVGCKHVDAILKSLTPTICLVGHHHEHAESTFGETRVVALAPVWERYYTLDPASLDLAGHPTPDPETPAKYR